MNALRQILWKSARRFSAYFMNTPRPYFTPVPSTAFSVLMPLASLHHFLICCLSLSA
jgi:hypothetical protein